MKVAKEEVYVPQPPRPVVPGKKEYVYKSEGGRLCVLVLYVDDHR